MGIYVGVNGTPKEITALYVGVNGVPKECTDVYVGVNGVPKSCYSGVKPGETVFTSSTNFTIPRGVKKIDCFCVGGGGGGSWFWVDKVGGVSGNASAVLGFTCIANGGANTGWGYYGGNGGSGGGSSGYFDINGYVSEIGGNGGSDGSDGEAGKYCDVTSFSGGAGQHTTTRYFGESNGTLYAGAGGGGGYKTAGAGGAGGGGRGAYGNGSGGNGLPNTGGGGGGGGDAGGAGSGHTRTVLGVDVTPGSVIPIAVGAGGSGAVDGITHGGNGGSGICIIRWGKQ